MKSFKDYYKEAEETKDSNKFILPGFKSIKGKRIYDTEKFDSKGRIKGYAYSVYKYKGIEIISINSEPEWTYGKDSQSKADIFVKKYNEVNKKNIEKLIPIDIKMEDSGTYITHYFVDQKDLNKLKEGK